MTTAFESTYVESSSGTFGDRERLTASGAGAIIQDYIGRFLFVRTGGDECWLGNAGWGAKPGKSIFNYLEREAREETGLTIVSAAPIAVHSNPGFAFKPSSGNKHQMLDFDYLVIQRSGSIDDKQSKPQMHNFSISVCCQGKITSLLKLWPTWFDSYDGLLNLK